MNTKKAIADAAREMLRIAAQVGRDLNALRDRPSYSPEERLSLGRKAPTVAELGRQAVRRVRRDVCDGMKGYIPETRLESHIAPNGYVMRSMVKAPQVVEIEAFEDGCNILIEKYTTEAGWDHQRSLVPGRAQKSLLKLNCSSCRKPSYARTTGDLQYGQTLCASCLSLHLAKSH